MLDNILKGVFKQATLIYNVKFVCFLNLRTGYLSSEDIIMPKKFETKF